MITKQQIEKAYTELKHVCGGVKQDYFALLFLQNEHKAKQDEILNHVAYGNNDYGIDAFHFDPVNLNLYLYQFKYTSDYKQFKDSFQRLIDAGMERIFAAPNKDDAQNQILLQLRSCLLENRNIIGQIVFRFVFTGDPAEADRSLVLEQLREDLENKMFYANNFFGERPVGLLIEFKSSTGRIAGTVVANCNNFDVRLNDLVVVEGPKKQKMHIGFIRLTDLCHMCSEIGVRFLHKNVRYGLGNTESVNREIGRSLKQIVLDQSEGPELFAFNHNGISLFCERVERTNDHFRISSPRLLNGAQTVTTALNFLDQNKANPKLEQGKEALDSIRVLCKIITDCDEKFITRVTINNNRQNPVEPWNLHANDTVQLELQEKFRDELGIYYERQENAFSQLTTDDLEEFGVTQDNKAIQLLKLTHTYLITDGSISRIAKMRSVFEDDRVYDQVFRQARLKADPESVVLCYKIQFRLSKITRELALANAHKYRYIPKARLMLWALLAQGLLNDKKTEDLKRKYGSNMSVPVDYTEVLLRIASTRVCLLLDNLVKESEFSKRIEEQNFGFLRSDATFDRCMQIAAEKWGWEHRKLA